MKKFMLYKEEKMKQKNKRIVNSSKSLATVRERERELYFSKIGNHGITLVALVITIIVLMILAGVSLSFVLGDNGILKKAQESADAYKNASQSEQQTLQNIEDYLYGEKGGNNTGDNTTGGGNIPAGLKVGSTVSYAPTGTYNWQAQYYASTDKITENGEKNVEATDRILDSSKDDYKINTWRVFEIDKTNQKVTLVPNEPTSHYVPLQGAQGYNNGVKLLNDACSKLYGTPSRGITARSIKIEDIENKLTASALASARGDNYLKQVSSAYSKENSYYPSIYAQEKLSVIDGTKRSTGLDISEQKTLIGRKDNGAAEGCLQASSIQPYNNFREININEDFGLNWDSQWSSLSKFFQTDTESGINYSDLLTYPGKNNYYWLASRALACDETGAAFGLYTVGYDDAAVKIGIIGAPLTYSFSIPSDIDLPTGIERLFPIVTVPENLIVPDGENFKVE